MNDVTSTKTVAGRIAGPLVVASIVAIAGAGIYTRDLALDNRRNIDALLEFASVGDRCTYRDCQRIERLLLKLEEDLDSHDEASAHREAAMRIEALENWVAGQR